MTDESVTPLPRDYTLEETAGALRMSTRWLRERIKADKLDHQRYGHKILFTSEQIEAARARYSTQAVPEPITTGRKKRSS